MPLHKCILACRSPKFEGMFSSKSIHRGTPAKKNGWRVFVRGTMNTKRKVVNEIHNMSRVYIEIGKESW